MKIFRLRPPLLKKGSFLPPGHPASIPRTPLAKRLWKIRQKIVARGESLLDWEEFTQEVRSRRGEREETKQASRYYTCSE